MLDSMENAQSIRMFRAYEVLSLDFGVGSLWWVDETIWQDCISTYDKKSTRRGHPGLSIRCKPLTTPFEMIPMLHGTSGFRGRVKVRGLSESESERISSFGAIKPVNMALYRFFGGIQPNKHKPRVSDEEMADLKRWLKEKGLGDAG